MIASRNVMALAIASVLIAGCGAARRSEPLASPPQLTEQEQRGQVVFMANCHQCHPGGEAGLGPAINDKPFPEFLKGFQVRHGLGTMPSFPPEKISEADLEALLEYLSALRKAKPKAP